MCTSIASGVGVILSDCTADAIVVWDWFFGLQREWRFVRALLRLLSAPSTRVLTAVVLDLEDKLDARQGRIPILSVSVHL